MPTHCYECDAPLEGPICMPCNETEKDKRIAEFRAAIVRLNDVLNEMWGRDDAKDFAPALGAPQIDKLMDAQNAAFALVSRK